MEEHCSSDQVRGSMYAGLQLGNPANWSYSGRLRLGRGGLKRERKVCFGKTLCSAGGRGCVEDDVRYRR